MNKQNVSFKFYVGKTTRTLSVSLSILPLSIFVSVSPGFYFWLLASFSSWLSENVGLKFEVED